MEPPWNNLPAVAKRGETLCREWGVCEAVPDHWKISAAQLAVYVVGKTVDCGDTEADKNRAGDAVGHAMAAAFLMGRASLAEEINASQNADGSN